jgi:hypothetical protein
MYVYYFFFWHLEELEFKFERLHKMDVLFNL